MKFAASECFKISTEVLSQEVNGETVLLNLEGESYFTLNEVGTHIWQLLKSGKSLAEIMDALLEHYDVESGRLENDVEILLDSLLETGLVNRIDA